MKIVFNQGLDHDQLPSIEEMKKWIVAYLFKTKGVRVNIEIDQNNLQRELYLLEIGYRVSVINLSHGI